MKPFNKAEALNGAPVVLRNGQKAFIGFKLSKGQLSGSTIRDPLHGYIVNSAGTVTEMMSWQENGAFWAEFGNPLDIVGMWEEPRKQATITFPAPLLNFSKIDETFYSITSAGAVIELIWNGDSVDVLALNSGFVFATREDAQAFLDAMKAARA